MSSTTLAAGIRHLRGKLALQGRQEESDEQLLHDFTSRGDDSAFAVLVHRHGPMVLHVCRRVLGHHQDAEDAFQATFLVLARNAAMLRDKTTLASFLHGTAYRTAMKAKQTAARRRKYEGASPRRAWERGIKPPADPADELSWREVRALLDEEIVRLPEMYRSVFVLCCLENISRDETARRLGLKEGTISSRLAEARKRLAQRLVRRGVEMTAVLAATELAAQTASALPPGLMAATIKAASATAMGEGLAGVVSVSVVELVKSATATMIASKAKIATVLLLAVGVLTGASVWTYRGWAPALSAESPAAKADDKPEKSSPKREATKTTEIQGRVLDPDGKPKAGAKLLMLEEGGNIRQLGTTEADGRFRVAVPNEAKASHLLAQAEGFGIDFVDFPRGDAKKPIDLRLVKDHAIRGRIVNTEGKPVAGARLALMNLGVYADNSMDSFLVAWKKRHFMSGLPGGVKHIWSGAEKLFAATTDAEGRFVLRGLGDERLVQLRLSGAGLAEDNLWIVNRDGFNPQPYNQAMQDNIPKGQEQFAIRWLLYGPDTDIVAEAEKLIRGVVKDSQTGKGRPGVLVQLTRREGGALLRVWPQARTDAQGRYEMHGARKSLSYMLEVSGDTAEGYFPAQVYANDSAGYDPITADITVKKGVIVTGKMIDGPTGKPVPGHVMVAVLNDNPFVKDYPAFGGSAWFPMQRTGADGSFRVVAIPGPVLLMGRPDDYPTNSKYKLQAPDPKYPQYFDNRFGDFPAYLGSGGGISPVQGNWCKVLQIKADAKTIEQDIVQELAAALPIRLQDAEGKPLTNVWITGSPLAEWVPHPIKCEKAECAAYQVGPGKPRLMVFYHAERKLAGTLTLKGDEKPPVVVKLGPPGSIKGRLLDEGGKPLAGVAVGVLFYHQRVAQEVHKIIHHDKQAVTDANGEFTVDELIPVQKFELSFQVGKRKLERTPKLVNPAIEVKAGECRDLGAIKVKQTPERTEE
jgi:RNA polymerase sigma factor (sigma-70 family)